jgi:hypothetical protein
MARARNIKPGFFANEELAECSPLSRLLFAGLWCIADRSGRLEDRPKRIKAELLPYDSCDADSLLSELELHGFIIRYERDEKLFIQVINFCKHQNPHVKEAKSTIPPPYNTEEEQYENSAEPVLEQVSNSINPADSLIPDSGFSETGEKPIMSSPCGEDGIPDQKRVNVPTEQIVELYNSILSDRLPKAIKLDDSRKRSIAARWKEMLKSKAYLDEESGLVWWTDFFRRVRLNPHWLGDNDRKWTASLNWIIDPKNFTKVLEYRSSTFMTRVSREELNRAANRTIGVGEQWDAPPSQRVAPDPLLLEGECDELPY